MTLTEAGLAAGEWGLGLEPVALAFQVCEDPSDTFDPTYFTIGFIVSAVS